MSLDNSCIDHIKQEFQYNDNRLDLVKFIWLMRKALERKEQDSHLICYELVRLFEEIDIDSSNNIEWGEFLEYLSQSNWLSSPPTSKRKVNSSESSLLVHAFHE
jgi:Ca2+-binding EF-hand superfamily protein